MPKKKETKEVAETTPEVVETEEASDTAENFNVAEPHIVRPQDLPLVVTPKGKEWANEAQAEYARTLNGYAYANPEKWQTKKAGLLANLARLEKEPEYMNMLRGAKGAGNFEVKNKLMEN